MIMRGSRNFCWGGGGVRSIRHKKALTMFFFYFFLFFSPQLILQNSSGYIHVLSKKTIIFQGSSGGGPFSWGPTFSGWGWGGSNCLFLIETHIACDFPGSGPPASPTPSGSAHVIPHIVVQSIYSFFSFLFQYNLG